MHNYNVEHNRIALRVPACTGSRRTVWRSQTVRPKQKKKTTAAISSSRKHHHGGDYEEKLHEWDWPLDPHDTHNTSLLELLTLSRYNSWIQHFHAAWKLPLATAVTCLKILLRQVHLGNTVKGRHSTTTVSLTRAVISSSSNPRSLVKTVGLKQPHRLCRCYVLITM